MSGERESIGTRPEYPKQEDQEIGDFISIARAENGPVFSEEIITRIAKQVDAQIVSDYLRAHDRERTIVLQNDNFKLALTTFTAKSIHTVSGDAEVEYYPVKSGARVYVQGITAIEIGRPGIACVRFIQQTPESFSRLVLSPRGATSFESRLRPSRRSNTL